MRTRELFEPLSKLPGLKLLPFEGGLELRVGRDKGGAIEALVAEAEAGAPVVFVGDDLTDEAGFRAVNAAHGPHLSVLMRAERRETVADLWLRPPAELRGFLKKWYRALE
jgi:trehalose-6-phosphatase